MSYEISVLRTLLRLAHQKKGPSIDDLVTRVGSDPVSVRRALSSLARGGLVQRTTSGLRLSLAGLAVAVACGVRQRKGVRSKPLPRLVRGARRSHAA